MISIGALLVQRQCDIWSLVLTFCANIWGCNLPWLKVALEIPNKRRAFRQCLNYTGEFEWSSGEEFEFGLISGFVRLGSAELWHGGSAYVSLIPALIPAPHSTCATYTHILFTYSTSCLSTTSSPNRSSGRRLWAQPSATFSLRIRAPIWSLNRRI